MTVQEFLKSDRQWPRHIRIAHAKWQLQKAKTEEDKHFWQEVVDANGTIMTHPSWYYN